MTDRTCLSARGLRRNVEMFSCAHWMNIRLMDEFAILFHLTQPLDPR